ncbi:ArsR/SmtB family transcription factor [Arthrobacter sp. SAFR-179]|uniref:ArsR/SmtB family transcription factor n=1 Tax=Arthrobacter sp. SAFR-179 TaxID=3387279 RepID=UPI003F7B98BF
MSAGARFPQLALRRIVFAVDPSTAGTKLFSLVVVSMPNILMHRTRSKIIRFLMAHGPATCEDVAAAFSRSAPSLQGQLSLLYEAGFLTFESGRYRARRDEIERQLSELAALFQSEDSDFKDHLTEASHFSPSPFRSNE